MVSQHALTPLWWLCPPSSPWEGYLCSGPSPEGRSQLCWPGHGRRLHCVGAGTFCPPPQDWEVKLWAVRATGRVFQGWHGGWSPAQAPA